MTYFETQRRTVTEEGLERERARGQVSEKGKMHKKKLESTDADRHDSGCIDGNTSCADTLRELNTSSHQDLVLEIVRDKKISFYFVVLHEHSLLNVK